MRCSLCFAIQSFGNSVKVTLDGASIIDVLNLMRCCHGLTPLRQEHDSSSNCY